MTALTFQLAFHTGPEWAEAVMANFDRFLLDHAAAEKKASGMAMSMVSHYPDKPDLVQAMAELAVEELVHFREVVKWIHQRGLQLAADRKDPYMVAFRRHIREGKAEYLLDRLLIAAIVERRGHERFGLVAEALDAGPLQRFYQSITQSEARHYELFTELAVAYFPQATVAARLHTLVEAEAAIVAALPIQAALH